MEAGIKAVSRVAHVFCHDAETIWTEYTLHVCQDTDGFLVASSRVVKLSIYYISTSSNQTLAKRFAAIFPIRR